MLHLFPARRALAAAAAAASVGVALAAARGAPPPPEPTPTAAPAAAPAEAAPPVTAFEPVPWKELHYSAHKFIFGAATTLTVGPIRSAELAARLGRPPRARGVPLPDGGAVAVSSATDLPFGRDEKVTLWLDPGTGAALGAEKTTLGGDPYHKLLRFTDAGLYTWRSAPVSAREAKLGPGQWTARKQYATEPAARPPEGTPVTDAYALLYLASAARLDRKDSMLRLVLLVDKGYVEVSFVAGGLTTLRAAFDESWPGGGRRRAGDVLVRSVRATGRALGAERPQDDVDLGFLGMRGALTLLVEVGSGIPVAFSGRAEHVGNLAVHLDRAVLAAAPSADAAPVP